MVVLKLLKPSNYYALKFFFISLKQKSNLSLYSLYYAETCNEFTPPVSASLRLLTQLLLKKCRRCALAIRWQYCVRFDGSEIWTPNLPFQKRTRLPLDQLHEQIILVRCSIHIVRPDLEQIELKFKDKPVLVGFRRTHAH